MERQRSTDENAEITRFADELPVAIWVGRVPSGDTVYVNRAFRKVLGMDPPEDAARGNYVGPYSVHTRSGEPYPEAQMPYERAVRARAAIEIDDLVIHRHDGGKTFLRVYATPLFDTAGEITHIVEAFTDITREVESVHARDERDTQLRQAQRMESLGSLAGGIAHDFNNLLTMVKLIVSHLSTVASSTVVLEGLKEIDEVTDSAARLTQALLGFARRGKNLAQRVDLHELASRVAELARRTVGRQITLHTEFVSAPLIVEGDPTQLEQVLMNLVVNARDAISNTGVLTLRTKEHEVRERDPGTLAPGRYAVVEVEDTGGGISPEVRDRIFDPYFTTKTTGSVKGTGLGLATVFGIMESHRGQVQIARTGPEGTTMRVLLPLSAERSEAPSHRVPNDGSVRGRGTILVVDDEVMVLRLITRALEELGYRVLSATGGKLALELLQREPHVDAVVLDLVMPEMSGRQAFLSMQALRPELPVILVTGYSLNHEAQQLLDLGVRALIAKPFSLAELSAALSRVVGPR